MGTYTTNLNLYKPDVGETGWGELVSENFDKIDGITPADIGAEPAITKKTAFNKDFGNDAGTVCEGNDARLSDARTPTAHAGTHGNSGTDKISIDAGQVTSGRLDNARLPQNISANTLTASSGINGTLYGEQVHVVNCIESTVVKHRVSSINNDISQIFLLPFNPSTYYGGSMYVNCDWGDEPTEKWLEFFLTNGVSKVIINKGVNHVTVPTGTIACMSFINFADVNWAYFDFGYKFDYLPLPPQ